MKIIFNITPELKQQFKDFCKLKGVGMSEVIRFKILECLEYGYIRRRKKQNEGRNLEETPKSL